MTEPPVGSDNGTLLLGIQHPDHQAIAIFEI